MDLGLIILAGGKSSRMGEDKALLKINGVSFLQIIVERARRFGFEDITISSNTPEKYKYIGKDVGIVEDIFKDAGPLGGIHASLLVSKKQFNLVIPCDNPFIPFEILYKFFEYKDNNDAVIALYNGEVEALCGIYSKNCAKAIESMLVNNNRRVRDLYKLVSTTYMEIGQECTLYNINTKQDYKEVILKNAYSL